jgi:glycosyltransferase involved in cell wall biosynthesis
MKISVVIPAYNAAKFLPRSIASAYSQTLAPCEVIVVDDGSTDRTAAVAAELGARVITRINSGPSAAKNSGVHAASGEWVAFLDADDRWSPDKLERQADGVSAQTTLSFTGVRVFDDQGIRAESLAPNAAATVEMLRYTNPITNSSVLVRREAFIRSGGFREDIRHGEDWELWFRLSRLGELAVVSAALTDYYVYPGSLSANPERMIAGLGQFIETTLLADLHGLNRRVWRQRILATQLASAGLIARDNGLQSEVALMVRGIFAWPAPFWRPKRFAMLAVSARNRWGNAA